MRWAILAITKGGLSLAHTTSLKLKEKGIDVEIYTLEKWQDNKSKNIEGRLEDFIGRIFKDYDILLFIMATGIVVRVIAKYLEHKSKDPGILVMDEKGKYVISLLSGHLGRANDMTVFLGELINAQPVITTASDVIDSIAVDTLAMRLGCHIESLEDAKNITALMVNGETVLLSSEIRVEIPLPNNILEISQSKEKIGEAKGIIYISNKKAISSFMESRNSVHLIPRNIIIGLGCRRGVPKERIVAVIDSTLKEFNIHHKAIKHITTVDIKKDEVGIIEAAKHYGIPVKIVTRNEIKKVEDKFHISEFVKETIGVGGVCEACGYITSNKGRCISKKRGSDGVTISLWEENSYGEEG